MKNFLIILLETEILRIMQRLKYYDIRLKNSYYGYYTKNCTWALDVLIAFFRLRFTVFVRTQQLTFSSVAILATMPCRNVNKFCSRSASSYAIPAAVLPFIPSSPLAINCR